MNCYVCVYLQPMDDRGWNKTRGEASSDRALKKYLKRYQRRFEDEGCFYDWGDDPSFFAAEEFLGDIRKASWGVCRPDVRTVLKKGDMVVFFCAQRCLERWKYYYVGLGTVAEVIPDHMQVWKKKRYKAYRRFYNLLVDRSQCHKERIHPYHKDWQERAKTPYVIFEGSEETHFNLMNPLLVATYRDGDRTQSDGAFEKWRKKVEHVKALYELLRNRRNSSSSPGKGKILRTSPTGNAHQFMNLSKLGDSELKRMSRQLLEISREVANE